MESCTQEELGEDLQLGTRLARASRKLGLSSRCGREGLVVGDEAPVSEVAQIIGHGVKVIGVEVGLHGEEGREKDVEVRVEVKGEVQQLREKRSSWFVDEDERLKRRLEPMWV